MTDGQGGEAAKDQQVEVDGLTIAFNQQAYQIDATPKMPRVNVTPSLVMQNSEKARIIWQASVTFDPISFDHGPDRSDLNLAIPGQTLPVAQSYAPRFNKIRGGTLVVQVEVHTPVWGDCCGS